MITNYKIVCLVQFNKIEFESSAILALSATVVLTSLVVPVELFRDKLSESDRADDSSEYVVYQGPRRPPSAFADAGLLALGPRHAGGARRGRVCVFGGPCSLPDPTQLPLPVRAVIQRSNYFSGPLQNGTQLAHIVLGSSTVTAPIQDRANGVGVGSQRVGRSRGTGGRP